MKRGYTERILSNIRSLYFVAIPLAFLGIAIAIKGDMSDFFTAVTSGVAAAPLLSLLLGEFVDYWDKKQDLKRHGRKT
jgi:hypothetical protein